MTFRLRLVVAATTAVVLAVVGGCLASFLVASSSLVSSVDETLTAEVAALTSQADGPQELPQGCNAGTCIQVVNASGAAELTSPLPVSPEASAVARGAAPAQSVSIDTSVAGIHVREQVARLPAGFEYLIGRSLISLPDGGALQVTTPLTGIDQELHSLAVDLALIAVIGTLVAVLLGILVARLAFVPLTGLTKDIEDLAASSDRTLRLDPGRDDELGRLRRAFNRLLTALASSREAQRQLVVDAGHELRTPLTSLRTNLEVARRIDELSPEERDTLVDDVLSQLDELTALVSDLVELSREGERPAVPEPVRLDWVVGEAVASAATHARIRSVDIASSIRPSWIHANRHRVARAVGNLLDNAVKWSPEGGTIEVASEGGWVSVRDHGPGVDEADIPHLFDRFYRSAAARSTPGSGLGLAIVAQVAEEAGGEVAVANAPGGGAAFTLSFPPYDRPA